MSTVYRDRERSRYEDDRTTVSARTGGGTKVTRYIVKEDDYKSDAGRQPRYDDGRSTVRESRYDDSRSHYDRGHDTREEIRIVRKERDEELPSRREYREEPRYSRESVTVLRDDADRRRDEYWRRPPGEEVQDKEIVLRRTVERDDNARRSGETMALSKIDDRRESRFSDYEMVNPPRQSLDERERDVARYIRTTDFYAPQSPQPQTIIIKQEPIIIRERGYGRDRSRSRSRSRERREEDFQIVKKSDIDEERSVARSRAEPRDEEYFYEKKVRERLSTDDERRDRRPRREISPGDSISQVGNRQRRSSSDDSMVYVRKERIEEGYGSDDGHRGRDLAAGALAGVGAAELLRNHKEKEGKTTSKGAGRVIRDVGAGAVGVVAAEAIRRYRSKSRHRSRSDSRGRNRRGGSRSRSRSRSHSRVKTVGALGLAGAAILAGAAFANRSSKKESPDRRSRSRTRRSSRSRSRRRSSSRASELSNDPNADDTGNSKKRNARIAGAGAVGAVAAALLEKHREKENGSRSRSRSKVRQALPVVATGLGAAALAGLYEKNKAKQEAGESTRDERRRSRSRSRPRTNSTYYDGSRQGTISDPGLIEYGNTPMYGNNYGAGYYGRSGAPEQDYYSNNTRDVVPAPVPTPSSAFNAREARERSLSRSRARSLSSDSGGRSHSRRRSRQNTAAAAAGAGVAAADYESKRKDRRDRRRSRQRSREQSYVSSDPYNGRDPYEDANWHATHSASFAQQGDPYAAQSGFYPQGGQFPPPPGSMPTYNQQQQQPQPTYTPQAFPPPPPTHPQSTQFDPYAPSQSPYTPRPRGPEENVSAEHAFPAPSNQHRQSSPDGVKTAAREMIPPLVTVQRPSTSTPVQQPRNTFPGQSSNPFDTGFRDLNAMPLSGEASPYARTSPQPKDIPVVTDAPSPLPRGRHPDANSSQISNLRSNDHLRETPELRSQASPPPIVQPKPENPYNQSASINSNPVPDRKSSAAERYTPVNPPQSRPIDTTFGNVAADRAPRERSGSPTRITQSPIGDPRLTAFKRPESQTKNVPLMPSPDIRPPSDDSLPQHNWANIYPMSNASIPSMPNLTIPLPPSQNSQDFASRATSAEEASGPRQPRPRSPETPALSTTPTQESHKRVSFAPKPEFSEAPKPYRTASDTDANDAGTAHRRHSEGRDRDRDNSYHSQRHDGRDDRVEDDGRWREREGNRDRDPERRHDSRRERSRTESLDRNSDSRQDHDRDRDRDRDRPKRSSTLANKSSKERHRDGSPGSESTEDLPDRFDEHGRKKPDADGRSPDEDIIAQSLDKILGGSGFGDVLGSFLGGSGGGSSSGRRSSKSHRR